MKTIIICIIAVVFNISYSLSATATGWTFAKVKNGEGSRQWNNNVEMPCPLSFRLDCKITIRTKSNFDVEFNQNGYIITITIDEIEYQNVLTNEVIIGEVAGSIIYQGEFGVRIDSCSEYPELNGITIDIPNTIVNGNGTISLFIPPLN